MADLPDDVLIETTCDGGVLGTCDPSKMKRAVRVKICDDGAVVIPPVVVPTLNCDGSTTDVNTTAGDASRVVLSGSDRPIPVCIQGEKDFAEVYKCDVNTGNTILIRTVLDHDTNTYVTTYFDLVLGAVWAGSPATDLTECASNSLESDQVIGCDGGVQVVQWIVKDNGQPTGVVYYTDAAGAVVTPVAWTPGDCPTAQITAQVPNCSGGLDSKPVDSITGTYLLNQAHKHTEVVYDSVLATIGGTITYTYTAPHNVLVDHSGVTVANDVLVNFWTDFGDGYNDVGPSPDHSYNADGSYEIKSYMLLNSRSKILIAAKEITIAAGVITYSGTVGSQAVAKNYSYSIGSAFQDYCDGVLVGTPYNPDLTPYVPVGTLTAFNRPLFDDLEDNADYQAIAPVVPSADLQVQSGVYAPLDGIGNYVGTLIRVDRTYDSAGTLISETYHDTVTGSIIPLPVGTAQLAPVSSLDTEIVELCDDNGTFLRHITHMPGGSASSVSDTTLDGLTPYVTVGTVSKCSTGTNTGGLQEVCVTTEDTIALDVTTSSIAGNILTVVADTTGSTQAITETVVDWQLGNVSVGAPLNFDFSSYPDGQYFVNVKVTDSNSASIVRYILITVTGGTPTIDVAEVPYTVTYKNVVKKVFRYFDSTGAVVYTVDIDGVAYTLGAGESFTACSECECSEKPCETFCLSSPAITNNVTNRVNTVTVTMEVVATGSAIEALMTANGVNHVFDAFDQPSIIAQSLVAGGELVSVTFDALAGSNIPGASDAIFINDTNGNSIQIGKGQSKTFSVLEQQGEASLDKIGVFLTGESRVQVHATVRSI